MSGRYERLRAAVVEVLDAEIGSDDVALRRLLMDALNEPGVEESPDDTSLRDTDAGRIGLAARSLHVPGSLSVEDEVEFVEAMERVPESAIQESPVPGSSGAAAEIADALRGVEAAVWDWECDDGIDEQDAIEQRRVLLQAINVLMGRDRNDGLSPRVEVLRRTTEAGNPPTPASAVPGSQGGGTDG